MKQKPPTEKSIMAGIITALSMKDWRVFRVPPSIYSSKGFPDLVCIKQGVHVWVECKSERGKLSPTQERFAQLVSDAGGTVIIARSVDYALEMAEKELARWKV